MLFVCLTVGLVLLASKYRENVFRGVKQICYSLTSKKNKNSQKKATAPQVPLDNIILADTFETCNYAIQRIRSNLTNSILGFDCEWVNEGPVAVIQLATFNGVCALFRLKKIGCIPAKLKELLGNRRLLKIGVASIENARKLSEDYGLRVAGTVDLRTLASRLDLPCPKSLTALCMQYLNIDMDKILEMRCSDWDTDTLTDEQMTYAAFDAHASVLVYQQIMQQARSKLSFLQTIVFYIKNAYNEDDDEKYHGLPHDVLEERYKSGPGDYIADLNTVHETKSIKRSQNINAINAIINQATSLSNKQLPTRNKPLYHNCYLQAPDGEILCTCDRKKAEWYVSKELGEIVEEDPLTVKLKFEPSGRALGEVGQYYTQVKINQCVVCGADDKFIRKNVVPREYRKYFPLVMKAHQSHDVLLLCPQCHQVSNAYDLQFRRQLADMCNAPLSCQKLISKDNYQRTWRKYDAVTKILKDNFSNPQKRHLELETTIKNFSNAPEFTPYMLGALQEHIDKMPPHCPVKTKPHGLKVVEFFQSTEGGLVELEKLWREHFLTTMEPKFLPKLWSVSHNQDRLVIRQTQNRIEPGDAKVAGLTSTS